MHDEHDNPMAGNTQPDLSDLEQAEPRAGRPGRPGMRASILAGMTLGVATALVIGQDISTVVSH